MSTTPTPAKPASAPLSASNRERTLRALTNQLENGIDIHRCVAAKALGTLGATGDRRAVDALIPALLDEDEDVRVDAATALAQLADSKSIKPLLENLTGDPCSEVKLAAIEGLVAMGASEVTPWLRRMVKGRDAEIVWDEDEFYASGWDDWVDVQLKAVVGLGRLGAAEAAGDVLAVIDEEGGQDISETVFTALAAMGAPGFANLQKAMSRNDVRLRRRIARVVGNSDDPLAAELVGASLGDGSPEVRLAVAQPLAVHNSADPRLLPLFWDSAASLRIAALSMIGAQHTDWIVTLSGDHDVSVRLAALKALAEHGARVPLSSLRGRLETTMNGDDAALAEAAARAYGACWQDDDAAQPGENDKSPFAVLSDLAFDPATAVDVRTGAISGLQAMDRHNAVAAALAVLVGDDNRQVRLATLAALSARASDEPWPSAAGDILLAALRGDLVSEPEPEPEPEPEAEAEPTAGQSDQNPAAQDQAEEQTAPVMSTLEAIFNDRTEAERVMVDAGQDVVLNEKDHQFLAISERRKMRKRVVSFDHVAAHLDVPRYAARLLGSVTHDVTAQNQIMTALCTALGSADAETRMAALESLGLQAARAEILPTDVAAVLLNLVGDGNRDVRSLALRALGAGGGRGAANLVAQCLSDSDNFVRKEAIDTLGRLGQTNPNLTAMLSDVDSGVRLSAARTLAQCGGAEVLGSLIDFAFYREGYHRREAGQLLAQFNCDAACGQFLDILDDETRKREWLVVLEALDEIHRAQINPDAPRLAGVA